MSHQPCQSAARICFICLFTLHSISVAFSWSLTHFLLPFDYPSTIPQLSREDLDDTTDTSELTNDDHVLNTDVHIIRMVALGVQSHHDSKNSHEAVHIRCLQSPDLNRVEDSGLTVIKVNSEIVLYASTLVDVIISWLRNTWSFSLPKLVVSSLIWFCILLLRSYEETRFLKEFLGSWFSNLTVQTASSFGESEW